jgi:hypothetical protein
LTKTTQRLTALKEDYLIRDYYRYVIFRKFNNIKTEIYIEREKNNKTKNNDKYLLKNKIETFISLKIIYIISHSLMNVSSGKIELIYIYYILALYIFFFFPY